METSVEIQEVKKHWYDRYYKLILFIPTIFLLISLIYLFNFQSKNGDIIYKDVTLTGGTTITVFDAHVSISDLKNFLSNQFPDLNVRQISDFRTGIQNGFIVESKSEAPLLKSALEKFLNYELTQDNSSIEFSGAALSQGFYKQLRLAFLIAFVFMSIVVFLIFRTFAPSLAVIFAAFSDIVMTIFVIDVVGITLSMAGVIAFLMLIGYSVDTDILLTNRVLYKRDESLNSRIYGAMKTGVTMTLTSIVAIFLSLFLVGGSSGTLRQIFTILLIGLGFDILNTWATNASMLKWYAEKRGLL